MNDNRSRKFIFVPFCLMAQAYQAQGIVKYDWKGTIKPIMQLLIDNEINIIQMPCAESLYKNNLIREPKGLSKYNTVEFNNHCNEIPFLDLLCYTIVDIHSTLYIEYYECNQMSRRKRDVIEACHNAIRANL